MEHQHSVIEPGDLVKEFTLVDHEGQVWNLSDHRGRYLLLIFHRHLM